MRNSLTAAVNSECLVLLKLNAQLLSAYRATHYVAHTPTGNFTLHIGEPCPALGDLMRQSGVSSAAFLTAYNPQSQVMSDLHNQQAQALLCAALDKMSLACYFGSAIDLSGNWPPEPSQLVLGISRVQALELVVKFKQNACLFIEESAIPKLLLADGSIIE